MRRRSIRDGDAQLLGRSQHGFPGYDRQATVIQSFRSGDARLQVCAQNRDALRVSNSHLRPWRELRDDDRKTNSPFWFWLHSLNDGHSLRATVQPQGLRWPLKLVRNLNSYKFRTWKSPSEAPTYGEEEVAGVEETVAEAYKARGAANRYGRIR